MIFSIVQPAESSLATSHLSVRLSVCLAAKQKWLSEVDNRPSRQVGSDDGTS